MNILLVLIPVTLLVVIVAVWLFFWAVNHQQFDDLDSPSVLPLMDDPATGPAASTQEASADLAVPTGATPPATGDGADDRPA
ncbi:cbb3-type cytochrome oxidase assembly protein CcoS [Rhodanobacter soli]|uniref:cbb3-type cytochrome oxidase assembly protein CcoS n=1 Tax=Rhodanobacter soli TaxID=590609 RepID=UPI0031D37B74